MTWIITSDQGNPPGDAAITYGITNAGGVFNLRSTGTVDYEIEWGDGNVEISTVNVLPHTYTAGNYTLAVYSDGVYRPSFNNVTADVSQITSVTIGPGANLGTDLAGAWSGATNMTSFVCAFDVTSGVTNLSSTWRSTSFTDFPELDFSSAITFNRAWFGSGIENFPPNMFDTTGTLSGNAFTFSWINARLSAQSIENILVSLDTNGQSNINLSINGGTNANTSTWSAAANAAWLSLDAKGWDISQNGPDPT